MEKLEQREPPKDSFYMHCEKKDQLKVGDLVRFKVSALRPGTTEWLATCAETRIPIMIVNECRGNDIPIEADLLNERIFEILIDGEFIVASESELTKRGLR